MSTGQYILAHIYGICLCDGEDDGERDDAPVHVRAEVLAVEPGGGCVWVEAAGWLGLGLGLRLGLRLGE